MLYSPHNLVKVAADYTNDRAKSGNPGQSPQGDDQLIAAAPGDAAIPNIVPAEQTTAYDLYANEQKQEAIKEIPSGIVFMPDM